MSIFTSKKRSKPNLKSVSRIPYGDLSLNVYKIRPYTVSLVEGLNEQLNEIINNAPDCIDGQNGDILDNYIKNWENRAKANLNTQRALRINIINQIDCSRKANVKNAKDWLSVEKENLKQIQHELSIIQQKYEEERQKYTNW